MRLGLLILALSICTFLNVSAEFVSLKSSEVNMRVGPGKEYPIIWIFMRANLPMLLIAEFDQWRKVRFVDNTEGWVHKNMISQKNTVIVSEDNVLMYRYSSTSNPIARVEKNVVLRVLKRESNWVKVEINNMKGWIQRKSLWGVADVQ